MTRAHKVRNICFTLLGAAALVLKEQYTGPLEGIIYSYGGNVSASFAVYFIAGILTYQLRPSKLLAAAVALLVVELFEALDGFGVMANVYDRADFAANAVGTGLALAVDAAVSGISARRSERGERSDAGEGEQPAAGG
ncbi:MAG: hypothetical protein JSU77_02170 [Fidelibacterota bacterium]|nr:MAG: hypothetical protein JSU77_02170 [Candidatus Neomarinimicrobiota bacterium]